MILSAVKCEWNSGRHFLGFHCVQTGLACHRMAALKKNTVPFPKHARTGQPVNRNSHIIPLILGHPNQIRGIYFNSNKTKLPNGSISSYLVRVLNKVNLVVKADKCNYSFHELSSNTATNGIQWKASKVKLILRPF